MAYQMNTIHTWIVPFLGERLFKPKKKISVDNIIINNISSNHPLTASQIIIKGHTVLDVFSHFVDPLILK